MLAIAKLFRQSTGPRSLYSALQEVVSKNEIHISFERSKPKSYGRCSQSFSLTEILPIIGCDSYALLIPFFIFFISLFFTCVLGPNYSKELSSPLQLVSLVAKCPSGGYLCNVWSTQS